MNKERKRIIEGNTISEIIIPELGGYKQKVLIEGKRRDLPVIITLHGGPGSPIPFSVGSRGLFPEFTDKFIMVYWDQLGCGANNHVIDESFHIKNYVDMTIDLIHVISKMLPENKIILFGTSWGSILALEAAHLLGNEISSVVTFGQITRQPICNQVSYDTLIASSMPPRKKDMLQKLYKQAINPNTIKYFAGCLNKYTNGYMNKDGRKPPVMSMVFGLLKSPDYRFRDFLAMVKNGSMANQSIWEDIIASDYSDMLIGVKIPYRVIQGETDIVTDTEYVTGLIKQSENPTLSFSVVPKCGHIPSADAIRIILNEFTEFSDGGDIHAKSY